MKEDDWINAAEACRLLGVRAQTLYAYASRNLLRAVADPADARRSLYRRIDVDALATRQGRSRSSQTSRPLPSPGASQCCNRRLPPCATGASTIAERTRWIYPKAPLWKRWRVSSSEPI